MAEITKPGGAKPAQPTTEPTIVSTHINARDRRDGFALGIMSAILSRKEGLTPISLARQVTKYTDELMTALDAQQVAH